MQRLKTHEEDPFFDKRDQNYRQLVSDHRYFDLFSNKKDKCHVKIPDTVIFQNGRILKWFFNSKQNDSDEILAKNTDKLNASKIFAQFSGLKKQAEGMNPLQILEQMRTEPIAHVPNTFLRCSNREKLLISPIEIMRVLQEQANQVDSLQTMVNLKVCTTHSRETLISEYRNDPGQVGPLYRYYKKTFFVGKRPEFKFTYFEEEEEYVMDKYPRTSKKQVPFSEIHWNNYENSANYPTASRMNIDFIFDGHIDDVNREFGNASMLFNMYAPEKMLEVRIKREIARGYMNRLTESVFTKTSDQAINKRMEASTKQLVNFIEAAHKIKVRKLIAKFLLDREGNVVFIGAKDLRFELLQNADYNDVEVNSLLGYTVTAEEVADLIRQFKKEKAHKVVLTDPKSRLTLDGKTQTFLSARERPTSSSLYQKLVIRECGGDFCAFYLNNPDKLLTGAESRMTGNSDNIKIYMKNESHEIVHSPFEINNILKVKCHERLEDVVKVLKHNHILPEELKNQQYGYNYEGIDDVFFQHLSKVFFQGREVESVINLYKTLKVCKMCYTVYALMRKYFDKHDVSDDSYFRFNQKYSKVGLPKGRNYKKTENSYQVEMFPKRILPDVGEQSARPETVPTYEGSIKKNVSPSSLLRTGQGFAPQTKSSLGKELQLSLTKALLNKSEASEKRTLNKTSLEQSQNTSLLNLTGDVEQPSKKSIRFITSARARPQTTKASERRAFFKPKEVPPKANQTISSNRLRLGVASFSALQTDLTTTRTENFMSTKHTRTMNLYDVLSDEQSEGANAMKIKKYAGITTLPMGSSPSIDIKRQTSFEGLIKSIHKDTSKKELPEEVHRSERKKSTKLIPIHQIKRNQQDIKILRFEAFYTGFRTLRHLHPNKITTPKLPYNLLEAKKFEDLKSLSLATYCEKTKMTSPPIDNEDLKFFVYNTSVGIPYMILESSIMEGKQMKTVVVCNDLFDNFIDMIEQYKELVETLDCLRIVLFNLPGQAFTSYDPQETYNNEFCSVLVDTLLFHLEETGQINLMNGDFYFVGFGFGGNVLAHLLHNAQDIIPNIKGLLAINSFTSINAKMVEMLDQLGKVLMECPPEMTDLPYNYQSILYGGAPLKLADAVSKVASNPISIDGRLTVIRGVKQSIDITRQFQSIKTPVFVVRSTRNCMVPLENMDSMMKISRELEFVYEEKISNLMKNKILINPPTGNSYLRKSIFYEGPHNIIEQRPEDAMKILEDFLTYFK